MSAKPHANVWTDPLTPLVMLKRTARVFPKREAVVHGKLRWSYAKFAEEVGRMAGALRRAGVGQGDRVAVLAPNTPAHLVAHFAMPLLGAPLVSINTRLAAARDRVHPRPLRREGAARRSGARAAARRDPARAPKALRLVIEIPDGFVRARARASSPGTTFAADAPVLPIENTVEDEEERDLDQLHLGHHRHAQGRDVHAPRRLPERGEPDRCTRPVKRTSTLVWTVPMFHCNGWCMAVGVHGRGGQARLPAQGRPGRAVPADRRRGHHAPERRADGAAHAGERSGRAGQALRPADPHLHGRRAAVADAARADGEARRAHHAPVRAHRDLRPARGLRDAGRLGEARDAARARR